MSKIITRFHNQPLEHDIAYAHTSVAADASAITSAEASVF